MLDENNNNNSFTPTFFILPFHIMSLDGITLGYAKVYAYIFEFWNKGLHCYVGIEAIMKRTGLAKTQVYEALSFFEKKDELKRELIKGKKYFIKPEMRLELIDDDSAIAEIAFPVERKNLSGRAEHNIKNRNKESINNINTTSISPKQKKLTPRQKDINTRAKGTNPRVIGINIDEMLKNNPHQIPEDLFEEWQDFRKAKKKPITVRVINGLNKELTKIALGGIEPIEAFEKMLERQWDSLQLSYFEKDIAALNVQTKPIPKGNGTESLSRMVAKYSKPQGSVYDEQGNIYEQY
jgi:hypothetical protein